MTPESKVKRSINAVLGKYRDYTYVYMSVPGGYGRSTLDYVGFCCGLGFAIEAKREGGKPTDRQNGVIEQIKKSETKVFVIDGVEKIEELNEWLSNVVESSIDGSLRVVKELNWES